MKAIGIPPAALADPKAVEMARVWVAQQGLHWVLNVGTYRDSGFREATAWGVMIADMARHVADALLEAGDEQDAAGALAEIRRSIAMELDDPTSPTVGEFKQTKQ
ncbi:DUF5076 domain-containing protein [Brevundimonas sp. DC300-4]|uniref:DUF5076 domain-containing protein n=1 Tax=unclassified Brevundimonas TaxID=2622653 RepID=UPI003CF77FFF